MLAMARLQDFKIALGQTLSNVHKARETYEDAVGIALYGDSVTDAGVTYSLQATDDPDAAAPVWFDVKDKGGVAIALPIQGEVRIYGYGGDAMLMVLRGMRIKSNIAVTADRNWRITKQYELR